MIYAYRCRTCGSDRDSLRRDDTRPCPCGGVSKRLFVVHTATAFVPHFNTSVGAYVSSHRQFSNLLRQRADENTQATGTDHHYVEVDPKDTKHLGVTDDGMEQTLAKAHDPDKKAIFI